MEFSEVVKNRSSIRSFAKQDIPKETLVEIVKEAQRSPSWVNSQPWKVYMATGKTAEKISKEHFYFNQIGRMEPTDWGAMSRSQWHPRTQRNMQEWSQAISTTDGARDFPILQPLQFRAPVYVYLTIPKEAPIYAAYDLGAFAQTLMLAAQNKGIDSIPAYELIRFPESVRADMGIPDDEVLAIGIALGYRDQHPLNKFVSSRVPVEEILTIKE